MIKILITGGNSRIALSVLRSLVKKRFLVTVASDNLNSLCFFSRFCTSKIIYPSPKSDKNAFKQFLLNYVCENKFDLLIPIDDLTLIPISEIFFELSKYVKITMPKPQIYNKFYDKANMLKLAESLNVKIPKSIYINDLDMLKNINCISSFPIIIKPRFSVYWRKNFVEMGFRKIIYSKSDLLPSYLFLHNKIPFPTIQEYIYGISWGVSVVAINGKIIQSFCHKRVRETNFGGVVSCLSQSMSLNQDMLNSVKKLIKSINWTGVAMFEFIVDQNTNIPYFIEMNGRFWGSLELAIFSGIDFPIILIELFLYNKFRKPVNYEKNMLCRWLKGDIEWVYTIMKSKDFSIRYRLICLYNFFELFKRNQCYCNFKRDDFLPGIWELFDLIFNFVRIKK